MKAITLWQPWATFKVCGLKKYETRSWPTAYRGPIAIHAAKRPVEDVLEKLPLQMVAYFRRISAEELEELPTGAVIATGKLVACHLITREFIKTLPPGEDILGDFTLGRYAWEFEHMEPFSKPIPARGKQGLWDWDERGLWTPFQQESGPACL